MKTAVRMQGAFTCGGGAIEYLEKVTCEKLVIITDRLSALDIEMTEKVGKIFRDKTVQISDFMLTEKKNSLEEIAEGVHFLQGMNPDTVIVVGDVKTINVAKTMVFLYEMATKKKLKKKKVKDEEISLCTKFIVVPSNSENATEISQINTIMIDDSYMQNSFGMLK